MTLQLNPDQRPLSIPTASATQEGLVKLSGQPGLVCESLHNEQDQGTLDVGGKLLVTDDANSNSVLAYQPGETDATKWMEFFQQVANGFGSRLNQIHGIGWNRGPAGRIDTTQGAMSLLFESRYQPDGVTRDMEFYVETFDEAGNSYRPFKIQTNNLGLLLPRIEISGGGLFMLQDVNSNDLWRWNLTDGHLEIYATITPIYVTTPNIAIARQQSALGAYSVDLIMLNNVDEVQLGNDSVETRIGRGLQLGTTATHPFLGSIDGSSAAVAPANEGRLRYNNTAKAWQQSIDTGAYADLDAYTPAAGNFANPQPTNYTDALDRMAALLKTLNGGTPIP